MNFLFKAQVSANLNMNKLRANFEEWSMEWNAESDFKQEEESVGWDDEDLYVRHMMVVVIKFEKLTELISFLPNWLMATQ